MYFFSFIYNMLKCQKEEKGFCKTQKYELQLLPAACCFHKNELEIFREDWPRRPPATVSYFFTSFPFSVSSIFQFLCRQLTHTACNTSSSVLPAVRTLHFHHFSFEVFSFFRKSPRFLPASAGRILPAAFLPIRKPEPRAPAFRPLLQIYPYLTYKSQTLTFGSAGQHHSITNHSPRRPPPSSDASGLPPFPSTLPQPSTPPISHFFFFFFLPPFFFFSFFFFLSSFPFFFFFFSLLFLVCTFFFLAFFYLLFCFFHFFFLSLFFITSPCTFFCVHHPKGCKTERSSVSRSRSHDVQWTSVLRRPKRSEDSLPLAGFRGSAPYSFLFFLYV